MSTPILFIFPRSKGCALSSARMSFLLLVLLLLLLLQSLEGSTPESTGVALWLNYARPVSSSFSAAFGAISTLSCPNHTAFEPTGRACQELSDGFAGMLGRRPALVAQDASEYRGGKGGGGPGTVTLVAAPTADSPAMAAAPFVAMAPWPPEPEAEGWVLEGSSRAPGGITVTSRSGAGVLYGAFRLLHLVRREAQELLVGEGEGEGVGPGVGVPGGTKAAAGNPPGAPPMAPPWIRSAPASPLRAWNLWDNRDRSVERGYAGKSVFQYEKLPETMLPRYRDYARLLASTGVNVIVWDNVNACGNDNQYMLNASVIVAMQPLVALFYDYGVRSFVVPCYSSPIEVGGLATADPFDESVSEWWARTAATIQETWEGGIAASEAGEAGHRPFAFGGFLLKADCEGEPGPGTYKRTELEGANAMADALAPVGAVAIWRAFAHPPSGEDQALYQFNLFEAWNKPNATRPNVVLQCKNGPFDFQVREPVHSLFGHLTNVNLILEFQATQEYVHWRGRRRIRR